MSAFLPGPVAVCWSWSCLRQVLCCPYCVAPPGPVWCCPARVHCPEAACPPRPALSSPSARSLPGLQGALPVHCQLGPVVCVSRYCSRLPLPLVYSLGFFSLNSIAYRRVIRVYQYEVGDDLSGRFFSSYFSSYLTVVYQCTRLPRRLRFLTNPLPSAAWDRGVCPPPPHQHPASRPRSWGVLGPGGHGMTVSLTCWGRRKPGALPC